MPKIICTFGAAMGLYMRKAKSQLISSSQVEANVLETMRLFDVEKVSLCEGFKYLSISLTSNNYGIKD